MKETDPENLVRLVEERFENRDHTRPFLITIDGMAASGKSTLSAQISKKLKIPVVRLDDYYYPRDMERQTGEGNSDLKRIEREILIPFRSQKEMIYQKFNPITQSLEKPELFQSDGLILEGTYSLHPLLREYADVSLFLTVGNEEQIQRLAIREPEKLELFKNRWLIQEREYFEKYNPEEAADWAGSLSQSCKDPIKK